MDYLSRKSPYDNRAEHPIPVLVLLDLKMPRLSGFDVLTWLQDRPILAAVPVVVLTGSVRTQDRREAEKLGAVGYLQLLFGDATGHAHMTRLFEMLDAHSRREIVAKYLAAPDLRR